MLFFSVTHRKRFFSARPNGSSHSTVVPCQVLFSAVRLFVRLLTRLLYWLLVRACVVCCVLLDSCTYVEHRALATQDMQGQEHEMLAETTLRVVAGAVRHTRPAI